MKFIIDYLRETITIENADKLNERIQIINKNARNVSNKYQYYNFTAPGYFYDIKKNSLVFRILENGEDRKLIIILSEEKLKITL